MRLLDAQVLAGPGLPVGDELRVDLLVQLACGIVGDVEQFDRTGLGGQQGGQAEQGKCQLEQADAGLARRGRLK